MKSTLTLLALFFAGVIHLQAQQQPIDEPTANEAAWAALVAEKKEAAAASPEAIVIKDGIMASDNVTGQEFHILELMGKAAGDTARNATARALAGSTKTGKGVILAKVFIKFLDRDTTDWSEEMIKARPDSAGKLASRPDADPKFKADVWAVLVTIKADASRKFFKTYRSTLPKAVQVEATQRQKNIMLAIPKRDEGENAWLAEISADLIALQLDQ